MKKEQTIGKNLLETSKEGKIGEFYMVKIGEFYLSSRDEGYWLERAGGEGMGITNANKESFEKLISAYYDLHF